MRRRCLQTYYSTAYGFTFERYSYCAQNVSSQDDQYESLEIEYSTITKMYFGPSDGVFTDIRLSLKTPPRLGKNYVQQRRETSGGYEASFSIPADQVQRWLRTVSSRGLVRTLLLNLCSFLLWLSIGSPPSRQTTRAAANEALCDCRACKPRTRQHRAFVLIAQSR